MGAIYGFVIVFGYFYFVTKVSGFAKSKGRSKHKWYFISTFLTPLVAYIIIDNIRHPRKGEIMDYKEDDTYVGPPRRAPNRKQIKNLPYLKEK